MEPYNALLLESLWERYDLLISQGDDLEASKISKEIYELQHNTP